jgi:flagellin
MAAFINTNISSLNAQRNLNTSQTSLQTSLQRLSSGLRINSAKDDSAGLAISTRMTAQINGMNQASRNANDAISMSQTAEGAMGSINDILLRMRDLSVQAANGSNGDKERASIQNEVDQLYGEIDRISSTTNFNGVKLLDGSAKNTSFQVGANANQTISFSINEVSTKAMSLNSTSGLGDLNAGRASAAANGDGTMTAAADGDLVLNGVAIDFNGEDAIGEVKDAINAMSGTTGVTASAYNIVKGTSGASGVTSGLTIRVDNAADGTAGTAVTIDNTSSMSDLVDKINKQVGGVTAAIGNDGGLVLSNETGAKITIGGTVAGSGLTANAAGNQGYLSFTSTSGAPITVGTSSGTAATALNKFGLNVSSGSGSVTSSGQLSASSATAAAATAALTQTKLLSSDDVMINGVAVGQTGASAAEKAAAINAISDQTGVTATASTTAYLTMNSANAGAFTINGTTVTTATTDDTQSVVTKINAAGIAGVTASTDQETGRLKLVSSSGNDIVIGNTNAYFTGVSSEASVAGNAIAATQFMAVRGTVTLAGEDGASVRVDGTAASVAKLGMVAQGGNEEAVGGKLSVSTAANAQKAIERIDEAIDFIANQRATMGAVQNRFTSTISNLQTSVENISASRSRIQDADFAAETANMTRNQILQQAGTAMLAQANSLPNGVLSLLRG